MSVTPQTNTDLATIARFLCEHDNYVICGHVSPDGDCIGSQLGLMLALRSLGKQVNCVLAKDEIVDPTLSFLPCFDELIPASSFSGHPLTFVAVDVPNRERICEWAAALLDECTASVTIDHHAIDSTMTDLVYVNPDVAAVAMLIWQVVDLMGVIRTPDIATCCYTGLATDTGRFQFQNTDGAALSTAADMVNAGADPALIAREVYQNRSIPSIRLEGRTIEHLSVGAGGAFVIGWLLRDDYDELGAVKADAEPIIDTLRSIAGVRVACFLRGYTGEIRGSLRAKDDTDVAAIAERFGGGGHRAAAGFTLECSMEEARATLEAALTEAVSSHAKTGIDV